MTRLLFHMVVRLEIKRNDGQYTYGDYLAEGYHGIAPAIILIHKISDMVGYILYIYIHTYIHIQNHILYG